RPGDAAPARTGSNPAAGLDGAELEAAGAKVAPDRAALSFDEVRERWREFVGQLSDKRFQALVRDLSPQDWDGQTLVIGATSAFHQQTISRGAESSRLEQALAEFYGAPIRVRCTLISRDESRSGGDVLHDPVVKHAQSLGAKIKRVVRDEEG